MSASGRSGAESLLNLDDYRRVARETLEPATYDYYAGGSWDEITLRENSRAFDRLALHYRVLRDVSERDLSTTVLGSEIDLPILLAPTAFQAMAHPEGEVATARAAANAGTIMVVSTLSSRSVESIAAAASRPIWFQLYVYKDRGATRALIERAQAAGCKAIVLTVDAQIWGERERDARNRFRLPEGLKMSNLFADKEDFPKNVAGSGLAAYVSSMFDQSLSWSDLEWLRSVSELPFLIKGLVHPEDARLAVEHGADGVFVSNHGGRQVDTAPATIDVLPAICEVVDGRIEVLLDGGVRRGSDVVKSLALGAKAVAVGRPVLWGLAVAGQAGVEDALAILRRELDAVMGLCGAARISELGSDLLGAARKDPRSESNGS
ncbi:MAG: alpha-hydroxy acid oxidase [Thermoanaerobaculia bacterium]